MFEPNNGPTKTASFRRAAAAAAAARSRCLAIGCLLSIFACALSVAAQKAEQRKIRISAVQARLFYDSTGTFSENVFAGRVDLWNSPFDSTYSTLVTVELDGVPEYLDPVVRIELTARYVPFDRERGSLVVRQTETIRNGSETGKSYAPFWLRRTGCNPVRLAARIVGRRETVKETINFGCGE